MCTELTEGSFEQTVQLSKGLELLFYYILPCIYRLLASANLGNLLFHPELRGTVITAEQHALDLEDD